LDEFIYHLAAAVSEGDHPWDLRRCRLLGGGQHGAEEEASFTAACRRGSPRRTHMQKLSVAALMIVSLTVPVLAEETFYVVFDNTLKGCTVVTGEPTDKVRYKVLGTYKSEAEAENAMPLLDEC